MRNTLKRTVNSLVLYTKSIKRGSHLSGAVLDEHGTPVSNATVRVCSVRGAAEPVCLDTMTGIEGRFIVRGVSAGEYVATPMWRIDNPRCSGGISCRNGDRDLRLTLATPGLIKGRVLLGAEPLQCYGLSLSQGDSQLTRMPIEITSSKGEFALSDIRPGTYALTVSGYNTRRQVIRDIQVSSRETTDVGDILLEPGTRVSGFVRDQYGSPVAGAVVVIAPGRSAGIGLKKVSQLFSTRYEAVSNIDGAYCFAGIDPGDSAQRLLLWSRHPTKGASYIHQLYDGQQNQDLVAVVCGGVSGSVRGVRGATNIVVSAHHPDEPRGARVARVSSDGTFELSEVPPGKISLELNIPASFRAKPCIVEVYPEQVVPITLSVSDTSVSVVVTVSTSKQVPILTSLDRPLIVKRSSITSQVLGGPVDYIFEYVEPGMYVLSSDRSSCTRQIMVAGTPTQQHFDFD
jgi:hypothetical protein